MCRSHRPYTTMQLLYNNDLTIFIYRPFSFLSCVWRVSIGGVLTLLYHHFVWRLLTGGLTLGSALKRGRLAIGDSFFCVVHVEGSTHRFIQCPNALQFEQFTQRDSRWRSFFSFLLAIQCDPLTSHVMLIPLSCGTIVVFFIHIY